MSLKNIALLDSYIPFADNLQHIGYQMHRLCMDLFLFWESNENISILWWHEEEIFKMLQQEYIQSYCALPAEPGEMRYR
jgi:hypothetical protein